MANISRLKAGEISPGNTIFASDLEAELDQFVNAHNANDTILSALVGGAYTMPGPITFTNGPLTNTISERTAGSGVTIDGLIIKDAGITFTDAGELTIATGAVTATGSYHTIDTESDAASDDLDTINGGVAGRELFVQAEHTDRTVVVKHNTGNIFNPSAVDVSLDDDKKIVHLIYSATLSKWVVTASPVPSASDTVAGVLEVADQSEMETGSSTTLAVTPGRQHFHPSALKAWIKCDVTGGVTASYNITSIVDEGTGHVTVNIANDFSSANYAVAGTAINAGNTQRRFVQLYAQAAGSFEAYCFNDVGADSDPTHWFFMCAGDL